MGTQAWPGLRVTGVTHAVLYNTSTRARLSAEATSSIQHRPVHRNSLITKLKPDRGTITWPAVPRLRPASHRSYKCCADDLCFAVAWLAVLTIASHPAASSYGRK